jgi:hypothetical protein
MLRAENHIIDRLDRRRDSQVRFCVLDYFSESQLDSAALARRQGDSYGPDWPVAVSVRGETCLLAIDHCRFNVCLHRSIGNDIRLHCSWWDTEGAVAGHIGRQ